MPQPLTLDQVKIVEFPATPVAIIQHHGDPAFIGDTIRNFVAWRKQAGLPPQSSTSSSPNGSRKAAKTCATSRSSRNG